MGGKAKKKNQKKQGKKKHKRPEPPEPAEDNESKVENVLVDFVCLNRGCKKPGIPMPCCVDEEDEDPFIGTWYCSTECYNADVESGRHAKLHRRCIGAEGVRIDTSAELKYAKKPRGLFADRDFNRGDVILNEVPLAAIRLIPFGRVPKGREDEAATEDNESIKRFLEYVHKNVGYHDYFLKEQIVDHPLYWASPDQSGHQFKVTNDKYEDVRIAASSLTMTLRHLVKVVFEDDDERLVKYLDTTKSRGLGAYERRSVAVSLLVREAVVEEILSRMELCESEGRTLYDLLKDVNARITEDIVEKRSNLLGRDPYGFLQTAIKAETLDRLVEHLNFSCRTETSLVEEFPATRLYGGLIQNYANHSCDPNALVYTFMENMVTVAARSIKKDEEICVSIIDVEGLIYAKERQKTIRALLGFTCRCACCESDSFPYAEGGSVRELIQDPERDLAVDRPNEPVDSANLSLRVRLVLASSLCRGICISDLSKIEELSNRVTINEGIHRLSVLKEARFHYEIDGGDAYKGLVENIERNYQERPKNRYVRRKRNQNLLNALEEVAQHHVCMELDTKLTNMRSSIMTMMIRSGAEFKEDYKMIERMAEAVLRVTKTSDRGSLRRREKEPVFVTINPFNKIAWLMSRLASIMCDQNSVMTGRSEAPLLDLLDRIRTATELCILPGETAQNYYARFAVDDRLSLMAIVCFLLFRNAEYQHNKSTTQL